jgi:hypothetical protein
MVLQILFVAFAVFALSRVIRRFKDGALSMGGLVVWSLVWIGSAILILLPGTTWLLARMIGVGRGVDAVIYLSIIAMFYGLFRLYARLEFIEHEITGIVRELALREKGGEGGETRKT